MNLLSFNNLGLSGKKHKKSPKPVFSSFSMDFKALSPEDEYHKTATTVDILRMSLACTEAFLKLGSSTDTQTAGVYVNMSVGTGEQFLVDPVTLLVTTQVFRTALGALRNTSSFVTCFSV